VRTADSTIIIITNFYLPRNFLNGRRERGHEGAWGTPKAPAAAPPLAKILDPPLNANIVLHFDCSIQAFGPHRMHDVQRRGLLLQMQRGLYVSVSVCVVCSFVCVSVGHNHELY